MTVRVNRALNIVLAVDTESHGTVYVYSVPVSREIYNSNFEVLSLTHARLWDKGAAYALNESKRVSYLMLQKVAKETGRDRDNPDGQWPQVQREFVNEILRLTTAAIPTDSGYDQLPLSTAIERDIIEPEDHEEIMSALVFFTLEICSRRRAQAIGMWSSAITLLGCTDFLNSLPKSTSTDNTGTPESAPTDPLPEKRVSVPR